MFQGEVLQFPAVGEGTTRLVVRSMATLSPRTWLSAVEKAELGRAHNAALSQDPS